MNITEYTEYILWAGGALIALVVAHGLWLNWRRRVAQNRSEAVREPAEQSHFDFAGAEDGLIDGVDGEAPPASADLAGEYAAAADAAAGGTLADADPPSDVGRPGRRIPIAGRRTEPTVPRNVRNFDNGADTHATHVGAQQPATDEEVANVVVIWVSAKAGAAFDGQTLLRTFMASDLKYGGNVFRKLHPHTRRTMFTVANGVEPGTFDLSDVESLATPRVVFLLRLAGMSDARTAFEEMLEVAQEVAVAVGGELKDERKNDLSGQTIEHYRQRIRDFKRINMTP